MNKLRVKCVGLAWPDSRQGKVFDVKITQVEFEDGQLWYIPNGAEFEAMTGQEYSVQSASLQAAIGQKITHLSIDFE